MSVKSVFFDCPSAKREFCDSLASIGFAVIKNSPISIGLINSVYDEWRAFFNSDEKHNYPFSQKNQDGYVPSSLSETAKNAKLKDIKEFYHIYFPWGRFPEGLSDQSKLLYAAMFDLSKTLLSWIEEVTPATVFDHLPEPLSKAPSQDRTLFRVIHYPKVEAHTGSAVRAAAHEDINFLTILPAATSRGLQVKDLTGKWHTVETQEGDIIINAGDMLQECSKHHYVSTTHRVINPEGEQDNVARMSMPLFLHPKQDFFLSNRYPTAEAYLNERLQELGLAS